MARDTLTIQFQLEASFETLQTIAQGLADKTIQTFLVSRLSETVTDYLTRQTKDEFEMKVVLKVPTVRKIRHGPRAILPKVENGILSWYDECAEITNIVGPVGSAEYVSFMDGECNKSFRYESALGSFTAIKEKRRGRPVWYAHRRRGGQLKRVYLGKSENLTATKLAETARRLNAREDISLTEG